MADEAVKVIRQAALSHLSTTPYSYRKVGTRSTLRELLKLAARKQGCETIMLETGPSSHQALAFYTRQGYARCGPYGEYPDHPLSVFMRKHLGP